METSGSTPAPDQRAMVVLGLGLTGLAVGLLADVLAASVVGFVLVLVGIYLVATSLAEDETA